MPPVGGAQQSQVAVGGTEALLKRGRRRLGISQHLRVKKQVGKRRVRSSRCVFCCDSGTRQGLTGTRTTRQGRQHNTHIWIRAIVFPLPDIEDKIQNPSICAKMPSKGKRQMRLQEFELVSHHCSSARKEIIRLTCAAKTHRIKKYDHTKETKGSQFNNLYTLGFDYYF